MAQYEIIDGVAIIPEGETKIGDLAFSDCSSLTKVVIPSSVTEIGVCAFADCRCLKEVVINEGVTMLSSGMFSNCHNLSEIVIPSSVTKIEDNAFSGCSSLKEVAIPSSVTKIGDSAFYGCNSLKEIIIPSSVSKIGNNLFPDCSSLERIVVAEENPKYDSREGCNAIIETETNKLLLGCKNTIIPSSVTEIGENAFYYCSGLREIEIPSSVTKIGYNAFSHCDSLTEIVIPSSVAIIENKAFCRCSNLKEIVVLSSLTEIEVGNDAFWRCSSLENIIIPSSVTEIGDCAFSGCSSLKEITIPSSVTEIGSYTFTNCSSLKSVNIMSEADLPCAIFNICSELETVTLPASINKINEYAFSGCDNLKTIYVPAGRTEYYKRLLREELHPLIVEIPTKMFEKYKIIYKYAQAYYYYMPMSSQSLPHVYVLVRLYFNNTSSNIRSFLEGLEKSLKTISDNNYKGEVTLLIYDDTPSKSDEYINDRNKLLDNLFKNKYKYKYKILDSEPNNMGSAYAMHRLREYFVSLNVSDSIAIILDQDDELTKDAIRNIVKRMPKDGIVVSPYRVVENQGTDITDDGGRIHNILARILRFKWLGKLLLDSRVKEKQKYKKLYFPFSFSEFKELFISIIENIKNFAKRLIYKILGLFKIRLGYADLSSICWTKSYSYNALSSYHEALTKFITANVKPIDTKDEIKTFYSQLNAYEDFIDFYVLLLNNVPISGNLKVSHIYKKHPDSITATPKVDDFQLKRTNSLLTLIDLCYSKEEEAENKFRENYKLMLHRFVASKVCQISYILNKYIENYKDKGEEKFSDFAAKVHNRYFVNKLTRLALGENRGSEQDKELFNQEFSRTENTKANFTDLFSAKVYKSIPQYKGNLSENSPKFILINSAEQEKLLRNIKDNKKEEKQWKEITSHRRTQAGIILILLIVFFIVTVDILVPSFRLLSPFLLQDNGITTSVIGFLGAIITILSREYARIKTSMEEDVSTLKLYYSEFSDFIRHLEANIKVLIEIRKQASGSKIWVHNIHSENLKWPENSILLSDEMAKLIPKTKVDDFTRLKINIRNINNSSQWLTELISNGKLTTKELDWEISRYFGYIIQLYYMESHNFKFASHDELDNYVDENFIEFKLTELFMSYKPEERMDQVKKYITNYHDDRRMERAILKK